MQKAGFGLLGADPHCMERAMTTLRAFLEDEDRDEPERIPYFREKDLLMCTPAWRALHGGRDNNLAVAFPQGMSKKDFQYQWGLFFRAYYAQSEWMYGPQNVAMRRLYADRSGFAPQCPQN